jgi:hypothetical protein
MVFACSASVQPAAAADEYAELEMRMPPTWLCPSSQTRWLATSLRPSTWAYHVHLDEAHLIAELDDLLIISMAPAPESSRHSNAPAEDADSVVRAGAPSSAPPGVMRQSGRTFSACGPFCPWVVSNSTFWFSSSDL